MSATYVCNKCGRDQSTAEYSRSTKLKRGHVGVCRSCHHDYYVKTKDVAIERSRKRRSTPDGRQRERQWQRQRRASNPARRIIQEIRVRARKRGLDFNLIEADIVIPSLCPVLGIAITPGTNGWCENSPSVDRIDPKRGYVRGNIAVISWRANRLKNDATLDELRAVVRYYESALCEVGPL